MSTRKAKLIIGLKHWNGFILIDFDGDGALQQGNRDNQPVLILHLQEHPFDAA